MELVKDTPIKLAIIKFEEAKVKATSVKDIVYLDGVLGMLDTLVKYEEQYLTELTNDKIEKSEKAIDDVWKLTQSENYTPAAILGAICLKLSEYYETK